MSLPSGGVMIRLPAPRLVSLGEADYKRRHAGPIVGPRPGG